jgi:hypothetical protein
MATLYILGAGCSANYKGSTRVPNLESPLNNNFFQRAKKVIEYYPSIRSIVRGLDSLASALSIIYGVQPNTDDPYSIFEKKELSLGEVMNYFFLEPRLFPSEVFDADSRLKTMNDLLAFVLAEALSGPARVKHDKLASGMKEGDVVFSFNYDILIDNALGQQSKLTDSGYSMRFDYSLSGDNRTETRDSYPSQVKLFKLHGSLNWLRCPECGRNLLLLYQRSIDELWRQIKRASSFSTSPPYYTDDEDYLTIRCPKCERAAEKPRMIIVPPAGMKDYIDTDIRHLWRAARYAGSKLERIIVIGYRFSEMDYELEVLLRKMIADRTLARNTKVTIWNRDPKPAGQRFSRIFGKENIETPPFASFDWTA